MSEWQRDCGRQKSVKKKQSGAASVETVRRVCRRTDKKVGHIGSKAPC